MELVRTSRRAINWSWLASWHVWSMNPEQHTRVFDLSGCCTVAMQPGLPGQRGLLALWHVAEGETLGYMPEGQLYNPAVPGMHEFFAVAGLAPYVISLQESSLVYCVDILDTQYYLDLHSRGRWAQFANSCHYMPGVEANAELVEGVTKEGRLIISLVATRNIVPGEWIWLDYEF